MLESSDIAVDRAGGETSTRAGEARGEARGDERGAAKGAARGAARGDERERKREERRRRERGAASPPREELTVVYFSKFDDISFF
jgi:hypothetical protein